MSDAILALNAGSSSLKFGLFRIERDGLTAMIRGQIEDAMVRYARRSCLLAALARR